MRQKLVLYIFELGLILSLLSACNIFRKPIECSQIQENALFSLEYGKIDLQHTLQWIANDSPFVGATIDVNGTKEATWVNNEVRYSADFRDNILISIWVDWKWRNPSSSLPIGNEILDCFGTPDLYQAWYIQDVEAKKLDLTLWYLKKGTVIRAVDFRKNDRLPAIDGNIKMTDMTIVAPGTVEEVAKNVSQYGYKDEVRNKLLDSLKPWPGEWEKIVVDTSPPKD